MTQIFLLLARVTGFFLISPLFSNRGIPKLIRLGLALSFSLLLAPPITQITTFNLSSIEHPLLFTMQLLKELAIGYLVGFLFSLLFEAAAFAGQIVGTMTGFSATELFDPITTSPHPLMGRAFVLITFALFLSLDLHHVILRVLYESFTLIPFSGQLINEKTVFGMIEATGHLFQQALAYAIFPLILLISVFILFALLSRQISFFWTGFPIQLLIGFGAISLTIGFFAPILEQSFYDLLALLHKMLFPL